MFMFNENPSMDPRQYRDGWRATRADSAGEIAKLITEYVASNCVWAHGVRLKDNFRYASWLGLDFDEGMTLNEAKATFEPYLHIIGTTKSHRREKNGKTADRFRVFLKFGDMCTDKDDYEATARKFAKEYGADKACVDAARFFFPCRDIIVSKYHGRIINAVDAAEERKRKAEALERYQKKWAAFHPPGSIPARIRNILRAGVLLAGKRNKTCFQIGADLAKLGHSENDIMDLIAKSNIIGHDFTVSEARRAVQSGMKKAGK